MTTVLRRTPRVPAPAAGARVPLVLGWVTVVLATVSALSGLLVTGGVGRHEVETARGAGVTLYGEGLYAADSWLVGAGNVGQDLAILLVEVPVLVVALLLHRSGHRFGPVLLTGVFAFFLYWATSMTFATAQNRLFPVYVAVFSTTLFGLLTASRAHDVRAVAAVFPDRPGRRPLAVYLGAVALALTMAWLPDLLATAVSGDVAEAVGPYTSSVTHALDLAVVVPVAVVAAVLLLRREPLGAYLTVVMLVLNVLIGVLLMAAGVAQLLDGVELTVAQIVAKMATFAVLTLVAGGLLVRLVLSVERHS